VPAVHELPLQVDERATNHKQDVLGVNLQQQQQQQQQQ
jgi:hypothetical protein